MIILLNNKEYFFDNIEKKNNHIFIKSGFKLNSILTNFKIEYDTFIDIFKNSLDSYVNIDNNNNYFSITEEYFNYFKITTNDIVKRNMTCKICYLIVNNFNKCVDKKIVNMFEKYNPVKKDKYYFFLKVILGLKSINNLINEDDLFDSDYFTLHDFILDYYND